MRKELNYLFVITFFLLFAVIILTTREMLNPQKHPQNENENEPSVTITSMTRSSSATSSATSASSSYHIENALSMKPIIDISGWQQPDSIDYDTVSKNISGAIVRIQSGSHTKKDNNASDKNGLDKHYKTHIEEFQKRNIPVAVYAYVTGKNENDMKKEASSFYKAASKYNPTFYWLDVEEKTMDDMNAGVETFRQELEKLGAKNIGIYIGTYFMNAHAISTEKFDSVWIPAYGTNSGYYNAAPNTDLDYDLHQYTSEGYVNGYSQTLDLNLITTLKDPNEVYKKLFTAPTN